MTRKEAIEILKDYDGYFIGHSSDEVNAALELAINSLEVDETYQLEYEHIPFITLDELKEMREEIQKGISSFANGMDEYTNTDVCYGLSIAEDILDKKISELEKTNG